MKPSKVDRGDREIIGGQAVEPRDRGRGEGAAGIVVSVLLKGSVLGKTPEG